MTKYDNFNLSIETKKAFCEAFESRIQELVPDFDYYSDGMHSPAPWCAPWTWGAPWNYMPEGMSAADAGKRWAEECAPEIAKAVAEEQEALKEVEE